MHQQEILKEENNFIGTFMINDADLEQLNNDMVFQGVREIKQAMPERNQEIIAAVLDVLEKVGLEPPPQVLVHKGEILANCYRLDHNCLIIAENIPGVLNGDELRAVITHELGHKKQSSILNKRIEMNEYFWQKGRFNDPGFTKRHHVASDKLTDKCELDADDNAANLFGAQNMASALIKLHVAACAENTLERAVIMNSKELRPEDTDRFIQEVESNQPNITLEEVKAKLQRVADGMEVCGEHDLNLRLPRLRAQQAKTL